MRIRCSEMALRATARKIRRLNASNPKKLLYGGRLSGEPSALNNRLATALTCLPNPQHDRPHELPCAEPHPHHHDRFRRVVRWLAEINTAQ